MECVLVRIQNAELCRLYLTFGRFNELARVTGLNSNWPTGDGYQWYTTAPGKGLQTGNKPALGACACWYYEKRDENGNLVLDNNGNPIPTGHTAIVEAITVDNNNNWTSLTTSNSAWYRSDDEDPYSDAGTPVDAFPYFYTRTYTPSTIGNVGGHPEAYFQGFIYHPDFLPDNPPGSISDLLSLLTGKDAEKNITILRRRH